jgi:hypothetical protein
LYYFRTVYFAITNPKILFLEDELNASKILSPSKGFIFILKLNILFLIIFFIGNKKTNLSGFKESVEYSFFAIYLLSVLLIMLYCVIFDFFENYKMDKFDFVFKCLAYTFLTIYPFGILCSFNNFHDKLTIIICLNLLFQIVFYYRIRAEISFNSAYKFRFIVISILFISLLSIAGAALNYYAIQLKQKTMNTYECKKCGMSVNAQCGKCNLPLENAHLTLENGVVVQISQCPSCMGKIKSPQCCGADMNCELN